jgi:hypothetical protein
VSFDEFKAWWRASKGSSSSLMDAIEQRAQRSLALSGLPAGERW